MPIAINLAYTWTDTNNKKVYLAGTLTPSGDYPGAISSVGDPLNFGNYLPTGYNDPVMLHVSGWAGRDAEREYFAETHMGKVASGVGIGSGVKFFNVGNQLAQGAYPSEITAAVWRFYAIYSKP